MATTSPTFEDIDGRHGETFKAQRRVGYDLTVDMWLRVEDRRQVAEARHRLAEWLYTDEPKPLYLPDDPTRYLLAIVSGSTDLDEITDDCPTCSVTFRIGDPDYYGRTRKMTISGTSEVSFAVGGTLPTYIKVTAKPTSSQTSWRITNTDTGEYVEVSATLSSSSTIRLDFAKERATVNNNTVAIAIASDYFTVSGRAHLKVSNGSAEIEWVERWL